MDTGAAYDGLRASDDIIAKALRISELAQMAKIEQRLREFMDRAWDIRRGQASIRARSMAGGGSNAKQIDSAVRKIMLRFPKDTIGRFNRDAQATYKLARKVAFKKGKKRIKGSLAFDTPNFTEMEEGVQKAKAQLLPSFTLADEAAISALEGRNVFWIGEHYDVNLAESISATTSETLVQAGASRRTAALLMMERVQETLGRVITPGGFAGTSVQYFEGLTANAVTVARVFGQLNSFDEIGITRYEIVNPGDSRTCPVCGHMNGKVFEISQGLAQQQAELDAESPEDIKSIHPWMTPAQIRSISSKPGLLRGKAGKADSKALAASGQALPPFHFRCRCTVDIDEAIGSFSALAA